MADPPFNEHLTEDFVLVTQSPQLDLQAARSVGTLHCNIVTQSLRTKEVESLRRQLEASKSEHYRLRLQLNSVCGFGELVGSEADVPHALFCRPALLV